MPAALPITMIHLIGDFPQVDYTLPAMASACSPLPPSPTGFSFGCALSLPSSTSTAARYSGVLTHPPPSGAV